MKKLLARLVRQSPAMIVAMLALFVALTGTAVATTSALITGKQIANNSITGADIKNKSVTAKDIRGRLRGARGLRGTRGPAGPQGAPGPQGPPGAPNPNAVDSDKVDGHHANELTRVGVAGSNSATSVLAPTIRATMTINAPRAGFVYVVGSVSANSSDGDIHAYVRKVGTPTVDSTHQFESMTSGEWGSVSPTWVFPVEAGTHTFQLIVATFGTVAVHNGTLTGLFSPFGSTGTEVLGAGSGRAAASIRVGD